MLCFCGVLFSGLVNVALPPSGHTNVRIEYEDYASLHTQNLLMCWQMYTSVLSACSVLVCVCVRVCRACVRR